MCRATVGKATRANTCNWWTGCAQRIDGWHFRMRFDRGLTLYCFRTLGGAARQVPVLMYHSVSDDAEAGVAEYYRVATSPRRFAEQMQWLAEAGYRGVSLEEALATRP